MARAQATPTDADARLRFFRAAASAPNTRLAYLSDLRHFARWGGWLPCWAGSPRQAPGAGAPGTPPAVVERYLAAFGAELKISTLRRRVAAINRWNRAQGCPAPGESELVGRMLAGIARAQARAADPALRARFRHRRAAPLLASHVRAVLGLLGDERPRDTRDRALLLTAWSLAARGSEVTGLMHDDLRFDAEGVDVRIDVSKTDQEGAGATLGIPAIGGPYCPVAALRRWLEAASIDCGFIFRAVDRWGRVGPTRLQAGSLTAILRERLRQAGVVNARSFSGHSFRAGLITQSVRDGEDRAEVQKHARHKSREVFDGYVRLAVAKRESFLRPVLRRLGS